MVISHPAQRLLPKSGASEFEPPVADPGHVDLYVGFAAEAAAQAFAEAVPTAGAPVPVDGRPFDDETVRRQVAARSTALPLTAAFDRERARLLAFAAERGGRDGGWGSPPPTAQILIRPSTAARAMSVRQCASASRTRATRS